MAVRWLIWCFLASCCISVQGAAAEVEADIEYVYYQVKPEPGRSLYDQILKDSPLRHKGRPVTANTKWNIKYERSYARTGAGMCEIKTYRVIYYCTMTLPRLESDDAKLTSDFNAYMPWLREHEQTHCRIAREYANQLEKDIQNLGKQRCGDMNKAIWTAHHKAITEATSAHDSFDRATLARKRGGLDHGRILLGNSYLTSDSPPTEAPVGPGAAAVSGAPADGFYQDGDGVWKNY